MARSDRVGCEHLKEAPVSIRPNTPEGCEECLRDGTHWVHLRLCLSLRPRRLLRLLARAARRPGTSTRRGHPVMRSFETGEAWRWCFVDERLG